MYTYYRAFTENTLKYLNVTNNAVKFDAASFCSMLEPITSYQDMYYIHDSMKQENVLAGKTWTAKEVIGDYITYFANIKSPYKFGIILVNDASFEADLDVMARVAFQQGITLLALGISSDKTSVLDSKLSLISSDKKTIVTINGLNTTFLNQNIGNMGK